MLIEVQVAGANRIFLAEAHILWAHKRAENPDQSVIMLVTGVSLTVDHPLSSLLLRLGVTPRNNCLAFLRE